jgi:hypothetical protein
MGSNSIMDELCMDALKNTPSGKPPAGVFCYQKPRMRLVDAGDEIFYRAADPNSGITRSYYKDIKN